MPYWGFNKMKIHIWSGFQTPSSHIIWNLTVGFHKGHHLMWYPKGFKLRIGLKTYPILTFFLYPPNIGKDPLYQMCEVIFFKNTRKYIYLVCRELAHVAKFYVGGIGILICCFPHMPFFFFFPSAPKFSMPFSFFWFNPHSCIWKILRATFFKVSKDFLGSSTSFFSHSRGEIGLVFVKVITSTTYLRGLSLQHCIHIFVGRSAIFIKDYKGQ